VVKDGSGRSSALGETIASGARPFSGGSRLLSSSCSAIDLNPISTMGDEIAPFSAARHSDIPATSTIVMT